MAKVVILSGAGISAESGLSTFRSQDGLWEGHDVKQVSTKEALANNRSAVIKFFDQRRIELKDKQPNHAHQVIAQLKHQYPQDIAVITQNIDDLFEKAGLAPDELIHLHGFAREVVCPHCGHIEDIGYKALGYSKFNGKCSKCSYDKLRPNVVLFHEPAPKYDDFYKELKDCAFFVVIGTNGSVIEVNRAAKVAIYSILNNLESSPHIDENNFAQVYLEPATKAIDAIAQKIESFLSPILDTDSLSDYFAIRLPFRSTAGLMVASKAVMQEIHQHNEQIYQDLMAKHHTDNPREATQLEHDERRAKLKIPREAELLIHKMDLALRYEYVTFHYPTALAYYDEDEIIWKSALCTGVSIVAKRPMLQTSSGDVDLLSIRDLKLSYPRLSIRQVLEKAESLVEDAYDYQYVAEAVVNHLSDKVWAKQILATAIEKSEASYELSRLSESILTLLDDKALAVQALEKAYATKKDMDDFRVLLRVGKALGKDFEHFSSWLAEYESACKDTDDHLALLDLRDHGRLKVLNQGLDSATSVWECLDVLEKLTS